MRHGTQQHLISAFACYLLIVNNNCLARSVVVAAAAAAVAAGTTIQRQCSRCHHRTPSRSQLEVLKRSEAHRLMVT